MDLDGKPVSGVEEFDENRKAGRRMLGIVRPEDGGAVRRTP
jgi:hypothetical protein